MYKLIHDLPYSYRNQSCANKIVPDQATISLLSSENILFILIPPEDFCPENELVSSAAYFHVHFRLDIFMEANHMNPGQSAPKFAM